MIVSFHLHIGPALFLCHNCAMSDTKSPLHDMFFVTTANKTTSLHSRAFLCAMSQIKSFVAAFISSPWYLHHRNDVGECLGFKDESHFFALCPVGISPEKTFLWSYTYVLVSSLVSVPLSRLLLWHDGNALIKSRSRCFVVTGFMCKSSNLIQYAVS